jgi:hypothetical protein
MTIEVYEDGYAISICTENFKGRESDYYFLKHLEARRRSAEAATNWVYTSVTRCPKPGRRHKNESKISWVENGF